VEGFRVIVLGLILLVLGLIFKVSILWTIGIVLVVVGAILAIMGNAGRKVGGRALHTDRPGKRSFVDRIDIKL